MCTRPHVGERVPAAAGDALLRRLALRAGVPARGHVGQADPVLSDPVPRFPQLTPNGLATIVRRGVIRREPPYGVGKTSRRKELLRIPRPYAHQAQGCPERAGDPSGGAMGETMAQAINDALIQGNKTTTAPGMPLVLMYHSVEPYQADPYFVTVSPPRFEQQMRWLARRGLRGVSMGDLLAARAVGAGKGLVGLTFDDGYADFARHALPVLRRFGFGATMFVIAGRLGGENAWDPEGPRKRLMDASEVWALARPASSRFARATPCPAARRPGRAGQGDRRQPAHPAGDHREARGRVLLPLRRPRRRRRGPGAGHGLRLRLRHLAIGVHQPARAARTYVGEADTAPRLWAKRARHQLAWTSRRAGKAVPPPDSLTLRRVPTPLE